MEQDRLRDRFRGALLGVAVGDALGAPFEGMGMVHSADLERLHAAPGRLCYTDDTHMTLGMAESLVAMRGFDGENMARTFARNFRQEPWRGYGAGPPQVFRMVEEGTPWDKAGRMLFGGTGSFGNGAAMRVAPCALAYHQDLEKVIAVAAQSASITHAHQLGIEGAVLQACAVAFLIRCNARVPFEKRALVEFLEFRAASPVYRQKLERVKSLTPDATAADIVRQVGNGIEAYEAVPAAICAFLRHPDSFSKAVLCAISLGGDTDTIACMTGALSGAYLGESAIPVPWREGVEGAGRLRELADALLALAAGFRQQEEPE
ncbi:MAG: ADP-ribosylglycohydrolase family protein [Dehalococcoidia bacterium]|nr:ADP-ribosylglycohydrolase family protein [Dehalococcoidia bacterium]